MKRLIKRYVLQAQIDKESDEVNEGELNPGTDQPWCVIHDMGPDEELRVGCNYGVGRGSLKEQ
jgi:hypothetical protein